MRPREKTCIAPTPFLIALALPILFLYRGKDSIRHTYICVASNIPIHERMKDRLRYDK